jgi:ubiquinone/menaquinone biosynthesis C-methylase UbiE
VTQAMDHLDRTREEFTRQADGFATSLATTDQSQVARLVEATGDWGRGRVLDVACGPGIVSAAMAERAHEVVALDLTPRMLEKARERCVRAGRTNVVYKEGSATALPFADASFDAVITRLSFHHFLEPCVVLKEMLRVLRPGGIVAIADVVSAEEPDKSELQNAIEVLRDPSHVRMLPRSELTAMIVRSGATIERQETWNMAREFEEWAGITAHPERIAPLRTVVRALAMAGQDAGMGLRLSGGAVRFFHQWQLIVARKT